MTAAERTADRWRVEARLLDHIKVMLDRDRAPTQHEWDEFKRCFDDRPQDIAYRLADRLYDRAAEVETQGAA